MASPRLLSIGHHVINPSYLAIPTEPDGSNHTPAFTKSSATQEAHDAAMKVTKGLALTGFRALFDSAFFEEVSSFPSFFFLLLLGASDVEMDIYFLLEQVQLAFEEDKKTRDQKKRSGLF